MATVYSHLAFDTLAYAQALIARGFEQKQAEALAVVTRDFVVSGQATNEFVQKEVQESKQELKQDIAEVRQEIADVKQELKQEIVDVKQELKQEIAEVRQEIADVKQELEKLIIRLDSKIDTEIALLENRINRANAKMLAFAVGIMLAGIPIIQVLLAKLS